MADDIAKLGIEIDSRGVIKATKDLDRLEDQSKKNEKQTKKLTKSFSGLGTAIGALGLGMAMRSVLKATIEQERAVAQLDAAVKSTGATAGFTSKELQDMASSLQDVTTFGDESIISMQSVLLTFTKLQGDILPRTTEAVLDLSARMGQDLQSSAVMLGKALNDPIANLGALGRAGIQFSDSQKETIKTMADTGRLAEAQGIILDELQTQFGGAAKAARDTFGGALSGLSNAFGDLMEEDGDGMQDAKRATEELTAILKDPGTQAAFSSITSSIISLTSGLVKGVTALHDFGTELGAFLALGPGDSVEDLDKKIDGLTFRIERLKKMKSEEADDPSFFAFLAHDAEEFDQAIAELEGKSSVLQTLRAAMTQGGQAGVADGEEVSIEDQATAAAENALMIAEAERAAQWEIDANKIFDQIAFNEETERLEEVASEKRIEIAEQEANARKAVMAGMFGNLIGLMNSGSKKMFNIGKVAAIANGLLNLRESVVSAYAAGSEVGGPILGAAYAATAGLAQAANLASIKGTSFGGGGASGAASSGLSTGTSITDSFAPEAVTPEVAAPTVQELRVVVEGDGPHTESMRKFAENLAETIKDMGGVGNLVIS